MTTSVRALKLANERYRKTLERADEARDRLRDELVKARKLGLTESEAVEVTGWSRGTIRAIQRKDGRPG